VDCASLPPSRRARAPLRRDGGWRFSSVNPQAGQEKLLAAGRTKRSESRIDADKFPAQTPRMAKKAAAKNGRSDLPVSQNAQQRVPATKWPHLTSIAGEATQAMLKAILPDHK